MDDSGQHFRKHVFGSKLQQTWYEMLVFALKQSLSSAIFLSVALADGAVLREWSPCRLVPRLCVAQGSVPVARAGTACVRTHCPSLPPFEVAPWP